MNRNILKSLIATAAVAGLTASAVALAQATAPAQELTIEEVIGKLKAAGYTAIEDLDKDRGYWEAEAVNASGQRVEVEINAATGEVTREEPDDDRD